MVCPSITPNFAPLHLRPYFLAVSCKMILAAEDLVLVSINQVLVRRQRSAACNYITLNESITRLLYGEITVTSHIFGSADAFERISTSGSK